MKKCRILSGLHELAGALPADAQKVWLICGPSRRFVDECAQALAPRLVEVFPEAQVHVPKTLVDRATASFQQAKADVILAVGGGSAIGLGKSLRLTHDAFFIAVPTTFAASEMTDLWGITDAQQKHTGKDERVLPDVVVHDASLLQTLPRQLKIQSLLNALAHPISALSVHSLTDENRRRALESVRILMEAAEQLIRFPADPAALKSALDGLVMAGEALRFGTMGIQHRLAHLLGGSHALPHAPLHALILPQFLMWLYAHDRALLDEISHAAGSEDLPRQIHALLTRAGAPTGLRSFSVSPDAFWASIEPAEIPDTLAEGVWLGAPASVRLSCSSVGPNTQAFVLGEVERASHVCIAIHGRASSAQSIALELDSALGDVADVAIVAPAAPGGTWIKAPYTLAQQDEPASVQKALLAVREVTQWAKTKNPRAALWLAGFSQGACIALSTLKQDPSPYSGVFAPGGALLRPDATPWPALSQRPVYLSIAREDPWVAFGDVQQSAREILDAGAQAVFEARGGTAHELNARDRRALRRMLAPEPVAPTGFGGHHQVELLLGALPKEQNTPRRAPYGLYPEQINGSAFVAPRTQNLRSWLYRVRPSAQHGPFVPRSQPNLCARFGERLPETNLCAWTPPSPASDAQDFLQSLVTLGGAGDPALLRGYALHTYAATRNMEDVSLTNADGDFLLIPQQGAISVQTEFGWLDVTPGKIALVPRGLRFSVMLPDEHACGYVGEVFARHFNLPERGPVGANGLAEARHFQAPTPAFEDRLRPGYRIAVKMGGHLFEATQDHSPYDVVAWHGNYVPYVFDLMHFSPVSNSRFDHGDPSIYTVLSAGLEDAGANALDFVVFPPRWDATEHTFRPPFFHRNVTTEFNGIIRSPAAAKSPFVPGMAFLTPSTTAHGVVAQAANAAFHAKDELADRPSRTSDHSLWFQFESAMPFCKSETEAETRRRIPNWHAIWGTHRSRFAR